MNKIIDHIKNWFKENRDDILLLLFVGLPTGLICILFSGCINFSNLF